MPELNEPLSERELEILRLVATGAANKEIAYQLMISPNTVKVHVRNIFEKIGVSSRTEATLYALKIGLVKHQEGFEPAPDAPTPAGDGSSADASSAARLSEAASSTGTEQSPDAKPAPSRVRWRPWMVGLLVVVVLLLLAGSGLLGARLMATATPPPTSIAVLSAQATVQAKAASAARWVEKTALPAPRKGMGVVEYENGLYVLAGETSQGIDGAVLRYDETKNNWTTLPDKPTPVTDIQAALVGEKIYVPGGLQADGADTNRLEVFDPRKGAWERKSDLPIPLSAYSLATFEGQIYLFGGKSGPQYSAKVFVYSPAEDRWEERTPMNSPRAYSGAVTVESSGRILVMGGYDGQTALKTNEAYIPTRDGDGSDESPWKTLAPLPEGRYAMGVSQIASIVFLMGGQGENGQPPIKPSIVYTIQSDQWGEYDKPPAAVGAYLAQLASGNYLYILGGETPKGLSASNLSYRAIYTTTAPLLINEGTP